MTDRTTSSRGRSWMLAALWGLVLGVGLLLVAWMLGWALREAGTPVPSTGSPAPSTSTRGPDQLARESEVPAFPWPPPRYSAFAPIAREWVAVGAQPSLASAADRLERAFDAAGYGERSYYRIPGGFALVSRIEQIRADATPLEPPARWAVATPKAREGIIDYIRALFNAAPGYYRVIVFVVTDQDFVASAPEPTPAEATDWIAGGTLRLPARIGAMPYTDSHYTSALIYEFERRREAPQATVKVPSDALGRVHLEKAGLWQALAAR